MTKAEKAKYDRAYRATNPEKRRAIERNSKSKSYASAPERKQAYEREKYAKDPSKRSADKRAYSGLPIPTRPMPELCEAGCGRKAKCLDHCHMTGIFRGWLCNACNLGLGNLGDTHEAIKRVDAYFVRAQSEMWLAIPGHGLPATKI